MTATILIVDDQFAGRETLRTLLGTSGYELDFAASGSEALVKAATHQPDLILLDVMMPGMDGYEVCRRLRADLGLSEVPVIMVTALDDRESRLHGIEAGADDFISKPFDRTELRARVHTITRLNRYRKLLMERAQFEWVVDQAADGYVIIDRHDAILFANARARLLLNLSPDVTHPIEPTFLTVIRRHYRAEPDTAWANWPDTTAIAPHADRVLVRPETATTPVLWIAVACLPLPGDTDRRSLIQLRDITAEVTTRQEMWTFHSLIAHKLRTPLMGMVMGTETLADFGTALSPEEILDLARSVRSGMQRLNSELNDVLHFLETPGVSTTDDAVPCSEWPARWQALAAQLQLPPVEVQFDAALEMARAQLSSPALDVIAWEVLENARKFHPRQTPQVTIALRADGPYVRIRFSDDGVWLPPEQLAHALRPYFQGEKFFTGQQPGMGLGLSLVASLVWAAGGTVRVFNRSDQPGVVVEVVLRLAHDPA